MSTLGFLEGKSIIVRLLFLLSLMLVFGLLFELLAFALVQVFYGLSPFGLSIEDAFGPNGIATRNAFRMLQFFLITGMFVVGPGVYVSLSKNPNTFTIGAANSTIDLRLALTVMLGVLSFGWMVEGLVRINLLAFEAFFPADWFQYLLLQSEESASQMAVFLTSESILEDVFTLIIIAFVPALAEEYLFRGVLQEELKNFLGIKTSILITATLFGLTHWQGINFLGLVSFGWLLGWIKQTSGSLWFPILAHFTNNVFVLIQVKSSPLPIEEALKSLSVTPIWHYLAATAVFTLCMFFYFRRIRLLDKL